MAQPTGPRPGWSRRAQYGLFFSFILAVVGLFIGIVLLAISIASPRTFEGIRGAALDASIPVTGALHQVTATVGGLASGAGNYWDAANQNQRLREERDRMRRELTQARAILQENQQLKAALQLRERVSDAVAAGRLVGSSFQSQRRYAILSAGSRDGVQIGMPVRAPDGLIGRIIDTGTLASRVLLISDRASVVPARLLRTGQPIISTGRGDGTVDLRPIEVGRNPFRPGDIVITSGTGGLYPPLVPVARVVRLDDDGAIAVPIASPAAASFAIVQPTYEPEALAPACPTGVAIVARAALSSNRKVGQGPRRGAAYVPALSVVAAILLATLPIVVESGWFPDFGFLMLIAWRLYRSDVWPAWWAPPLGLLNDLVLGYPLGFSVVVWTASMIALDLIDRRTIWRDYWIEWALAALLILMNEAAQWQVAAWMGAAAPVSWMVPPLLISILSFPLTAWAVVRLDQWRLGRG